MRVAIPQLGGRVSPRGLLADAWTIAELHDAVVVVREAASLPVRDDAELIRVLSRLNADLLVCGGIQRAIAAQLGVRGIRVIDNVVGPVDEVLDVLRQGRLRPMHGFAPWRRPRPVHRS